MEWNKKFRNSLKHTRDLVCDKIGISSQQGKKELSDKRCQHNPDYSNSTHLK